MHPTAFQVLECIQVLQCTENEASEEAAATAEVQTESYFAACEPIHE